MTDASHIKLRPGDASAPEGTDVRAPLPVDEAKVKVLLEATEFDQTFIENRRQLGRLAPLKRLLRSYYFVPPPPARLLVRRLMRADRMMPTFASLGAVRSGTSSLADYVMQHPCVALPLSKELLPALTLESTLAGFPTRREQERLELKYGMAMTGFCTPLVPQLTLPYTLSVFAPEAKIVILMRNPVERAFAHWRWDEVRLAGLRKDPLWKHRPDFDEIVRLEVQAWKDRAVLSFCVSGVPGHGYLGHGVYLPFVKSLLRFYPRDRVLFVESNEFFSKSVDVAKRVYAFLGLPPYEPVPMPPRNAAPPGKMSAEVRRTLVEFFEPLNSELYAFIGRDFGWK